MDDQKADDRARFLDLSDKAAKLEELRMMCVSLQLYGEHDVFRTVLTKTLADLAEIVGRAAGGDE